MTANTTNTSETTVQNMAARDAEKMNRLAKVIEMAKRAVLPKGAMGLIFIIDKKAMIYITLNNFADLIYTGSEASRFEKANAVAISILKKAKHTRYDENSKKAEPLRGIANKWKNAEQAEYSVKLKFESDVIETSIDHGVQKIMLSTKMCQKIFSTLKGSDVDQIQLIKLTDYFISMQEIGLQYSNEADCLIGVRFEGQNHTHEKLTLSEKQSFSEDDQTFVVRTFNRTQPGQERHVAFMTSLGLAELIFRNRNEDNCQKIEAKLSQIDNNLKSLGGKGFEKYGVKTSLGKKPFYIITEKVFIKLCDRLKWDEEYRLPQSDWDIQKDGLRGFQHALIACEKQQKYLKWESVIHEIAREGGFTAPLQAVPKPKKQEVQEKQESVKAAAQTLAPQTPAPEKTIFQKLEEIAARAKAKKRAIDEAMNLEMVELFSREGESERAKMALERAVQEREPSIGEGFAFS